MDAASSVRAQAPATRLKLRATPLRLAIALTLFALLLRLIGIGMRPLWLDEAYSAWFSSRGWHELWTDVPTYEPHPPFFYSLLKLWRDMFGGSAVALRTFSVLLALATVPLIVVASTELERQRPTGRPLLRAGIAGFLAAASPMLVLLGQEARPYPLLIFAYALALLGLLRLMREFTADHPGEWASWLMLAAGAELGLWAHGLGLLYALCLAGALAPTWLKPPFARARLVRGIIAALLIALLYLPCLLMMMNRAGDWGTGWLSWSPAMLLQLFSLYAVPGEVLTAGSAVAALILVLLAKRAVQAGIEEQGWSSNRAILVLWWGPPLLAALISQLFMPIFLARTLAATIVPACLALSGALARVESRRERFALAVALVITLSPTAMQIALRPAAEQWDQIAAYLKRNVGPGDQIWLYPNDSALPLREAGATVVMRGIPGDYPAVGVKGPVRAGSPAVVSATAAQARFIAEDPRARGVPTIWLVTRQSGVFDPQHEFPDALARVRRPGGMVEWGYISVRPYSRR
jgi:uncharacterized membrane protein